jgi:hypothetical protein
LEVKDPQALVALYDPVLAAFADAYLEDPHDMPEIARRLGDHLEHVSYDAPIHGAEDIGATPLAARVVNVKPSRTGSVRALFHADAPNDVAPSAYNEDDPPDGLPASPLAPRPEATGFRWAG